MTITAGQNTARVSYAVAQGVTQTSFSVPFEFFNDGDLKVYVDGTLKTITTHYTVSGGDGSTGTVTMSVTGATGGSTVIIVRDIPLERTTDFPSSGAFDIAALNTELDTIIAIASDVDTAATRSLRLSDTDTTVSLTIPDTDTRKGTVLGFNASTGAVEAGPKIADVNTLASVTSDIATLADIEDGTDATDAIQTVAGVASSVPTVAGIAGSVSTVASVSSNVTTVAGQTVNMQNITDNLSAVQNAATNATNAASSASAAATSESNAATSEANASTSETNAATSETNASNSASAAATSATNAATSETNASTSETNAATSETNAATSASNAATSATAASASQVAAAASAASAASSYDTFDDRYLGTKTSNPTLDNDGDALVEGALYFNSTANEMRVYDGANWIAASSAGSASLLNYHYTATADQTTFSGADDNSATLSYTVDNLIVTLNGVVLEDGTDYTATNGTSVVLASGAALNDELNIVAFKSFTTADMVSATNGGTFQNNIAINGDMTVDTNTLYVDSTNNAVGIGTTSPVRQLHVNAGSENVYLHLTNTATGATTTDGLSILVKNSNQEANIIQREAAALTFSTNATERMRIDSSGNLLVGTTDDSPYNNSAGSSADNGFVVSGGRLWAARYSGTPLDLNRTSDDGNIINLRKDGSVVGSIGTAFNTPYISSQQGGGLRFSYSGGLAPVTLPVNTSGSIIDNSAILGAATARFALVYSAGGVSTGSDQNEKQQIAFLTDAEIAAAKRISAGFKTFKRNDAVAAKGDNARTHTGVMAQEVKAALEAEGLDAGRYGFFMSDTWWETQTEVPAVAEQIDEEGNVIVEAQESYTRTAIYETAEEAPEGAIERTRLGIRYAELLAFVGAATEQRLANIETRLTTLENA